MRFQRRVLLILAAGIALSAVLASAGCRPPLLTPQALDPDLVPEDVRESLESTPDVSNIVWHVAEPDWSGKLLVYAATYDRTPLTGVTLWIAQAQYYQKERGRGGTASVGIDEDKPFWGQCSGGAGLDGDEWRITLDAGGYCLDGRATEVIGVTTGGRRFTSPVCNGSWVLVVEDPTPHPNPMLGLLEGWEEITARNSSGRVLHRLDLGR